MEFNKKKILILGATGVVGTAMRLVCEKRNIYHVNISHKDLEITDTKSLASKINEQNPEVIINATGVVGPRPCEENPSEAFAINTIAVNNLSQICKEKDITLVQLGSHAIFDGDKKGTYTEEDVPKPINVYGISKYSAELFVEAICDKYYIIRFPTLYGPRTNEKRGIVDKFIQWANEDKDLTVADDKIDSPTYSLDAADATISLILEEKPFGVYHVCNEGVVNYFEFITEIVKIMGKNININHAKDKDFPPPRKPLKTPMESIKIKSLRNWKEALKDYMEEYHGFKQGQMQTEKSMCNM